MDIILSGKLFKKVEEHLEATKANREVNENLPNCSQVRLILNTPESNNKIVVSIPYRVHVISSKSFSIKISSKTMVKKSKLPI